MTIQTRLHLDKNKNNNNNNNRPGTSSGSCPVSLPWEVGKERALYHSRPLSLLDLILRPPGGSGDENSFVQKNVHFQVLLFAVYVRTERQKMTLGTSVTSRGRHGRGGLSREGFAVTKLLETFNCIRSVRSFRYEALLVQGCFQ